MDPAPGPWRPRVLLIIGGMLIAAGAAFFVHFIDAAVRATIVVDMVPGGVDGSSSELDSYYRTMVWTLTGGVGALGAGILALRLRSRWTRRNRPASI
jgi:hypothetical protein